MVKHNRTIEFEAITKTLKSKTKQNKIINEGTRKRKTEFFKLASELSSQLTSTTENLHNLSNCNLYKLKY